MKLYHGQRVSCEIEGVKIDDARISINPTDSGEGFYLCQNFKDGESCPEKFGYAYSWFFALANVNIYKIKLLEEEGFRPKVGDIISDNIGHRRKVLEVFTNTCILSYANNFHNASSTICTFTELGELGYKIEPQEPIKELTRQEIADKFGIPLDKLKIKND